ncbi:MAG: hypothetical protein M3P93_13750 [Actinomycetota bacterium]|nr:hypothetical protein [Actinomycetota bacterium]
MEDLAPWSEQITSWVQVDLQLTNIHGKLIRRGVQVPYRTLHRFAVQEGGFGRRQPTLRVADGKPGVECQVDFARSPAANQPAARAGTSRLDPR